MEPFDYEKQAKEVADKIGIVVVSAFQGGQCPDWSSNDKNKRHDPHACDECGTVHGEKYRVTIQRKDKKGSLSFDYWASWASCNVEVTRNMIGNGGAFKKAGLPYWESSKYFVGNVVKRKHTPTYYDILSCLSSDLSMPTDPDDVVREFGSMMPSQAIKIAEFARKLQAFFSEEEKAILAEVQ